MVDEIGYDLAGAWPRLVARRRGPTRGASRPPRSRTRCGSGWPPRRPTSSSSRPTAGSRRCGPSRRPTRSSGSRRPARWRTGRWRRCCPRSGPGVTEHDLALRLEWLMRTGGAEALAFDVACLAGPEAALPHGSPGDRPVLDRRGAAVRLRGPGRGLPQRHDADAVRRRADGARPGGVRASSRAPSRRRSTRCAAAVAGGSRSPTAGRIDAIARDVIDARRTLAAPTATAWATGSASRPTRSPGSRATAPETPLPSPTVFSRGAGDLPRGRDRRPDRGPRPPRRVARRLRAADALPAGRHLAARLTRPARGSAAFGRQGAAVW